MKSEGQYASRLVNTWLSNIVYKGVRAHLLHVHANVQNKLWRKINLNFKLYKILSFYVG